MATKAQKTTRRSFGPRNPRTYYAMTKDKTTLYRFGTHAHRLASMKQDKLVPIDALTYRAMQQNDIGNKLIHYDKRGQVPETATTTVVPPEDLAAALAEFRKGLGVLAKFSKGMETLIGHLPQQGGGSFERPLPTH